MRWHGAINIAALGQTTIGLRKLTLRCFLAKLNEKPRDKGWSDRQNWAATRSVASAFWHRARRLFGPLAAWARGAKNVRGSHNFMTARQALHCDSASLLFCDYNTPPLRSLPSFLFSPREVNFNAKILMDIFPTITRFFYLTLVENKLFSNIVRNVWRLLCWTKKRRSYPLLNVKFSF